MFRALRLWLAKKLVGPAPAVVAVTREDIEQMLIACRVAQTEGRLSTPIPVESAIAVLEARYAATKVREVDLGARREAFLVVMGNRAFRTYEERRAADGVLARTDYLRT